MTEKERTKEMRERYSWRLYVDKNLKAPAKVLAMASGEELRVFISKMIEEQIAHYEPTIKEYQ